MKLFNREFTRAEKVLIAVLVVILLGLVYYNFVEKTVRNTIESSRAEAQTLEMEITLAQAEAARFSSLKGKLDELEAQGKLSWMGSYNNSKAEVAFLNDLLADTISYSISFSDVTRKGDQIRRNFKLRYSTGGFRAARNILERLEASENRCLIGDVRCSIGNGGLTVVDAQATFYETMVGGVADSGLPADSAAANR